MATPEHAPPVEPVHLVITVRVVGSTRRPIEMGEVTLQQPAGPNPDPFGGVRVGKAEIAGALRTLADRLDPRGSEG